MLKRTAVALGLAVAASALPATAHAQDAASAPYAVEYYYKIEWGHFDEWMDLYKRNHYPILERRQEAGDIVEMRAVYPRHHAGEASRWDFRFTIVYKDVVAAHRPTDPAIAEELYPDQETFRREEQRRFQLLIEHMDVPIEVEDLSTW